MGLMMHNPRSFSFSLIDEQDLNFSVRLDPTQRKPNQSINKEHNLPADQLRCIMLSAEYSLEPVDRKESFFFF